MPTIVDRCISDSSMSWASGSWAYLPQEFVGFTAKRFENLALGYTLICASRLTIQGFAKRPPQVPAVRDEPPYPLRFVLPKPRLQPNITTNSLVYGHNLR
jgi:hypothetical protein